MIIEWAGVISRLWGQLGSDNIPAGEALVYSFLLGKLLLGASALVFTKGFLSPPPAEA